MRTRSELGLEEPASGGRDCSVDGPASESFTAGEVRPEDKIWFDNTPSAASSA